MSSTPNEQPIVVQQQDQIDKSNEPPSKRGKSNTTDELIEIKTLTDINDFCHEKVFKNLSLIDLMNVADSCKRLQNAARLAYTSKYGRYMVCLGIGKDRSISIEDDEIRIFNFSSCLKVLRCFGDLITKLDFCSIWSSERKLDEFKRYLNQYCADSLVSLKYGRATLKYLTKPFKNVKKVRFTHGDFQCNPVDVNRCFPNLRAFIMQNVNAVDCVLAHIPNLKLLDISVSGHQQDKITTMLRLNQQLRRLHIEGFNLDLKFLRFLSEYPQLDGLNLLNSTIASNVSSSKETIHFKSVKVFWANASELQKFDAANITIKFDQLDKLAIFGQANQHVFHFISNHPTISNFKHWHDVEMNEETVLKFAEALPSVTKLSFVLTKFSANNVITIITKCHLLKYIRCLISFTEYRRLKGMMRAEWRSSFSYNDILELKR